MRRVEAGDIDVEIAFLVGSVGEPLAFGRDARKEVVTAVLRELRGRRAVGLAAGDLRARAELGRRVEKKSPVRRGRRMGRAAGAGDRRVADEVPPGRLCGV